MTLCRLHYKKRNYALNSAYKLLFSRVSAEVIPARPNPFNANLALLAILGILQNLSFIYGIQDDLDECNFDL